MRGIVPYGVASYTTYERIVHVGGITVVQQHGEDRDALVRRIKREISREEFDALGPPEQATVFFELYRRATVLSIDRANEIARSQRDMTRPA